MTLELEVGVSSRNKETTDQKGIVNPKVLVPLRQDKKIGNIHK